MSMNLKDFGNALRFLRLQKGLRIRDIVDEHISRATISNIERGVQHVSEGLRLYYRQKLGVDDATLEKLIQEEKSKHARTMDQLLQIESKIDLGLTRQAAYQLRKIHVKNDPYLYAHYQYLKGRYFYSKGNYLKSKDHFEAAIRIIQSDPELERTNIRAACLKDIARISFYQESNLQKALAQVDEGLKCFVENGERQDIKYFLLIGKVGYLEKLHQEDDALHVLSDLWEEISSIKYLDIKLNMYEIRASLLNQKKKYEKALQYAKDGFKMAAANQRYERAVELATIWGIISANLNEFVTSEECFKLALSLEDKIKKKYLLISTYTELGKLYTLQRKKDALPCLKTAVDKGSKSKDVQRYCQALLGLGEYFLIQSLYQEAVNPFEKAHEIAAAHNLDKLDEQSLICLSQCWKELGNTEKYVETTDKLHVYLKRR